MCYITIAVNVIAFYHLYNVQPLTIDRSRYRILMLKDTVIVAGDPMVAGSFGERFETFVDRSKLGLLMKTIIFAHGK